MAYPLITVGGRYRDVNTTLDLTNDLHLNGTSPTIQATTSGQSLTIIGGSGTTDDLILRATSGAGASGSDIILQVGNAGATEAMRILYDGKVGIGTAAPSALLEVAAADAVTNTTTTLQTLTHTTSGTAAAGFGVKNVIKLENAAGTSIDSRTEETTWFSTAAGPSDYAQYIMRLQNDTTLVPAIQIIGSTTANTTLGVNAGAVLPVNNGKQNVLIGTSAGAAIQNGWENVCVGYLAGQLFTGDLNTFVGSKVGQSATSNGTHNTCIGGQAASSLTDGDYNVFLGMSAGSTTTTGAYNILIGEACRATAATTSYQVRIGNDTYKILDGWCNADAGGTTLMGFQAAATASVADVTIASQASRAAGDLLHIDNTVGTTKLSVDYTGKITCSGGVAASGGVSGTNLSASGSTSTISLYLNDSATNTAPGVFYLSHNTTATAAAGFGTQILLRAENAAGTIDQIQTTLISTWTNATAGSETSQFRLQLRNAGAAVSDALIITSAATSVPLDSLPTPAGTPKTSGGSMADGTYYYVITALDAAGETIKSPQSSANTITGGGGAGSVELTWNAVAGATSYKVYRTTVSGTYTTPAYIGNPTVNGTAATPYVDTLLTPSAGAPPTATTTNPAIKLSSDGSSTVRGAQYVGVTSVDHTPSPYLVTAADYIIAATTAGGTLTVQLPSAVTYPNRIIIVKDVGGNAAANNITVSSAAGNIDGGATYPIDANYESVTVFSDGANWFIIAKV